MAIAVIASTTLTSNANSIVFSSIPATYTDLWIKIQGKTNISGDVDGVSFRFNGTVVSSGGFAQRQNNYGNGTSAASGNFNGTAIVGSGTGTTNIFGDAEIYIPNYRSGFNKSVCSDSSTAKTTATFVFQSNQFITSGVSAAITSVTIDQFDSGGTQFVTATNAVLYGITNA